MRGDASRAPDRNGRRGSGASDAVAVARARPGAGGRRRRRSPSPIAVARRLGGRSRLAAAPSSRVAAGVGLGDLVALAPRRRAMPVSSTGTSIVSCRCSRTSASSRRTRRAAPLGEAAQHEGVLRTVQPGRRRRARRAGRSLPTTSTEEAASEVTEVRRSSSSPSLTTVRRDRGRRCRRRRPPALAVGRAATRRLRMASAPMASFVASAGGALLVGLRPQPGAAAGQAEGEAERERPATSDGRRGLARERGAHGGPGRDGRRGEHGQVGGDVGGGDAPRVDHRQRVLGVVREDHVGVRDSVAKRSVVGVRGRPRLVHVLVRPARQRRDTPPFFGSRRRRPTSWAASTSACVPVRPDDPGAEAGEPVPQHGRRCRARGRW